MLAAQQVEAVLDRFGLGGPPAPTAAGLDAIYGAWVCTGPARWRQPFPDVVPCLLLADDVSVDHCLARYEVSREMSPFNAALHSCTMRGGRSVAIAHGHRCETDASGTRAEPLGDDRTRVLVEDFGYSRRSSGRCRPTK